MATTEQRSGNRWLAQRHLPTLVWSLFVAALLLVPGSSLPDTGTWDWLDKPLHALLFAVHTALLARSCRELAPDGRDLTAAAAVSAGFAVLLEVAQRLVPGRSTELWDLGANLAGIALVVLVIGRRRARVRVSF